MIRDMTSMKIWSGNLVEGNTCLAQSGADLLTPFEKNVTWNSSALGAVGHDDPISILITED